MSKNLVAHLRSSRLYLCSSIYPLFHSISSHLPVSLASLSDISSFAIKSADRGRICFRQYWHKCSLHFCRFDSRLYFRVLHVILSSTAKLQRIIPWKDHQAYLSHNFTAFRTKYNTILPIKNQYHLCAESNDCASVCAKRNSVGRKPTPFGVAIFICAERNFIGRKPTSFALRATSLVSALRRNDVSLQLNDVACGARKRSCALRHK